MTVTVVSFRNKFDEFSGQSDSTIELALEEAAMRTDSSWGRWQDLGTLYWAAHIMMLEIQREGSTTGQMVRSESIEGVGSISYATPNLPTEGKEDDLTLTAYGLRLSNIMRNLFPTGVIV